MNPRDHLLPVVESLLKISEQVSTEFTEEENREIDQNGKGAITRKPEKPDKIKKL